MSILEQKIVLPGTFLSTQEEFSAGENAYDDEIGNIYASIIGLPVFDEKTKVVSVKAIARENRLMGLNSVCLALVSNVRENFVMLELLEAKSNKEKRVVSQPFAILPIANVKIDYVNALLEEFKTGDILLVKVVEMNKFSTVVSTKERKLGVIKAFCSKCRKPLLLNETKLKCLDCLNIENRKISTEYGKGFEWGESF